MEIINSVPPLAKPLNQEQKDIVEMLKEALAQALEGNISSLALIVCMKGGYAHTMAGHQAADLNMGCDSLKLEIIRRVEGAGAKRMSRF